MTMVMLTLAKVLRVNKTLSFGLFKILQDTIYFIFKAMSHSMSPVHFVSCPPERKTVLKSFILLWPSFSLFPVESGIFPHDSI